MSEQTAEELNDRLTRLRDQARAEGKFDLPPEEPAREDGLKLNGRIERTEEWEPDCVGCGKPLGYRCREGSYLVGRTLCGDCADGGAKVRLQAAGISEVELNEPLDGLKPHDGEGRPYGVDWQRYMAFLHHFAELRPGARLNPPFAFVYGSNGVGKSAGAERALRDAIMNGCRGRNTRLSSLLDAIYSGYGSGDAEERVRFFSTIHLLVVQEVGLNPASEHAWSRFFDLVDDRSRNLLPTIFTSNYAPQSDSLGARSEDDVLMSGLLNRLQGHAKGNVFLITGASWRTRR